MEQPILPNGDSWWDRYGAIGAVAFLALAALYWIVRNYLAERREEKARAEREKTAYETMLENQRKSLADLNAKLLEVVQRNHTETLELLEAQRSDHEERFTALLERHIASSDLSRERTLELAGAVTKALQSIAKKSSPEGRDGGRGEGGRGDPP